jgi:hypothetical protein
VIRGDIDKGVFVVILKDLISDDGTSCSTYCGVVTNLDGLAGQVDRMCPYDAQFVQ